jgi:hypothetical protein
MGWPHELVYFQVSHLAQISLGHIPHRCTLHDRSSLAPGELANDSARFRQPHRIDRHRSVRVLATLCLPITRLAKCQSECVAGRRDVSYIEDDSVQDIAAPLSAFVLAAVLVAVSPPIPLER